MVVGIQLHTQGLGLIPRKGAAVKVVRGTSEGDSGKQTVSHLPLFLLGPAPGTATDHNTCGLLLPHLPIRHKTLPCCCLEERVQYRTGQPLKGQSLPPTQKRFPQKTATVNIIRVLAKHSQVWLVDDGSKYPLPAVLILPQDALSGHTKGHHPHSKEEEEEEDIYHLKKDNKETHQCPAACLLQATHAFFPSLICYEGGEQISEKPTQVSTTLKQV